MALPNLPKNKTSEYRIIYTDLLDRLSKANNGRGMRFQDLDKSKYLEYLSHMGIPAKDIANVSTIISDMFSGKKSVYPQEELKKGGQTHMLSDKDLEELQKDSDFLPMTQSHPYTKTKHEPRKTVFGAITKI